MIEVRSIVTEKCGVHDITGEVKQIVAQSGVRDGLVTVQVACADAGILTLSCSDLKIKEDLLADIRRLIPSRITFRKEVSPEGTAANLKNALFGSAALSILKDGQLVSEEGGQSFCLCDYDGPQELQYYVSVMGDR